jgi:hypothetical protein
MEWPVLLFGWLGPILAILLSVTGIVRAKIGWLIAAAAMILPFSLYLAMNPGVRWGIILPLWLLIAAGAMSRGSRAIASSSVLIVIAMLLYIAMIVFVGEAAR